MLTPNAFSRPAVVALALAAAAALLAGCNSKGEVITGSLPSDGYRSAYPIVVTEGAQNLDIPVGSGTGGLQPFMRDIVMSFGRDALANGTSGVLVMLPSGSANQASASYLGRDVRKALVASGLNPRMVQETSYTVADRSALAPIRLTFNRIKAVSPPCGNWSSSIIPDDKKGTDGAEFGCATQSNLAAMVENPNDLITPRAETPIPAWKRWVMQQQYGATVSGF